MTPHDGLPCGVCGSDTVGAVHAYSTVAGILAADISGLGNLVEQLTSIFLLAERHVAGSWTTALRWSCCARLRAVV